jgi:hypothetical protein
MEADKRLPVYYPDGKEGPMSKIIGKPVTFQEKKRYWKKDSIIKDLNTARNALYHAGFDEIAGHLTREMHKRFDFLEKYAEGAII